MIELAKNIRPADVARTLVTAGKLHGRGRTKAVDI